MNTDEEQLPKPRYVCRDCAATNTPKDPQSLTVDCPMCGGIADLIEP